LSCTSHARYSDFGIATAGERRNQAMAFEASKRLRASCDSWVSSGSLNFVSEDGGRRPKISIQQPEVEMVHLLPIKGGVVH